MKFSIVYLVVYLPTNLTLNGMQISEYDITEKVGELSYTGKLLIICQKSFNA